MEPCELSRTRGIVTPVRCSKRTRVIHFNIYTAIKALATYVCQLSHICRKGTSSYRNEWCLTEDNRSYDNIRSTFLINTAQDIELSIINHAPFCHTLLYTRNVHSACLFSDIIRMQAIFVCVFTYNLSNTNNRFTCMCKSYLVTCNPVVQTILICTLLFWYLYIIICWLVSVAIISWRRDVLIFLLCVK